MCVCVCALIIHINAYYTNWKEKNCLNDRILDGFFFSIQRDLKWKINEIITKGFVLYVPWWREPFS